MASISVHGTFRLYLFRLIPILFVLTAGCDSQGGLEGTPVDRLCEPAGDSGEVLEVREPVDTTLWIWPAGSTEFSPLAYVTHRCDWPLEFDVDIIEGNSIALDRRESSTMVSAVSLGESVVQVRVVVPATRDTVEFRRTYAVKDYCDEADVSSLNPYVALRVGETYRFEERRVDMYFPTSPRTTYDGILSVTVEEDRCQPHEFEFDVVEHFEGTKTTEYSDPVEEPVSWTFSKTYEVAEDRLKLGVFTQILPELPWPEDASAGDTLRISEYIPPGCCGGPGSAQYVFVRGEGILTASMTPPGITRGGTTYDFSRID